MADPQHPYVEYEGTALWWNIESAISDPVRNNDLEERTPRPYIVGYICRRLDGLKGKEKSEVEL